MAIPSRQIGWGTEENLLWQISKQMESLTNVAYNARGITSVGLSMPPAYSVPNSPLTSNGTLNVVANGIASQYVRGDGTLADFPTSTGGGSSVSYYLNSSVSQGTIGGVAYRQLGKTPISGAGTDIAISTTGYVASYLTDANDPALLEVPAGNFNCEFYFSVNNNTGNPFVYAEVYKYDGATFTLLGTSVGVPEYINEGTVINPYYFGIPVSQSVLSITDRIAIRIYVNVDGRTVTLHTENNHLCQVVTTFSKGLTTLNSLTRQVQFFGTGTSGTDFGIVSSVATHTFNLPIASAANTGKLSSTDWSVFNGKQAALSFTAPLINTSNTISIPVATASVDGYLDNADWTTFNNKQGTITLTTTGTSGAATFSSNTLNIPQYQGVLTNPVTGTGTTDFLPKFTGASALGDSAITDDGTTVTLVARALSGTSATFSLDATINGVRVGTGGGNIASNTAIGSLALFSNTTGTSNTAIGLQALYSNTTGNRNTANGYQALYSNSGGGNNTANGFQALFSNTTGSFNTANGYQALFSNTTGGSNTAIGRDALRLNTTGSFNTAIGLSALSTNTTGANNTALGYNTLLSNTTGGSNTAIGLSALRLNTTGSNNTALGYNTQSGNFSGSLILGYDAVATANNQFVVGSSGTPAGAVATEVNSSSKVWNVIINGVAQKILLA